LIFEQDLTIPEVVVGINAEGKRGSEVGADPVIKEDLGRIVSVCSAEMGRLSGKSLLITGGTGFVGRYLVESVLRFNNKGNGGRCKLLLPTRQPDTLIERYRSQIQAGEIVAMRWGERYTVDMKGDMCDYIIHAASPSSPKQVMEDPVRNLRDMVDMSSSIAGLGKQCGSKRSILISSGAVYGEQPSEMLVMPEEYLGGPDLSKTSSCYGEGKRLSEKHFRLSGIDYRIARVFSLTGPYQDLRSGFAVPDLIWQAAEKGQIHLSGDGSPVRSYCYATDLTIFLFKLLLGQPKYEVYNVGCREATVSIAELAQTISAIFGGVGVTKGQSVDDVTTTRSRYVPQLDRMYEFYRPHTGLREGLLRSCHSLYNRGLIGRKPVIGLEQAGFENGGRT
jgi:dTDP-glucose 4,6-dehydratase